MSLIQDAKFALDVARQDYQRRLRAIDSKLRAAVSMNPDNLPAAEDVQKGYSAPFTAEQLHPLQQPYRAPAEETKVVEDVVATIVLDRTPVTDTFTAGVVGIAPTSEPQE